MTSREIIARRAAQYFQSGDVVNLGIGIPALCTEYAAPGVMFQTENGYLGTGVMAEGVEKTESYCNATAMEFVPVRGGSAFDHCMSFGMIRGGRVDATVLGALQVAENGDLANWASPGRAFGMGGAMDLAIGAKKVILAMEMCTRDGKSKIVKRCTFPLTGLHCVDYIVTEYGVMEVTDDGLLLTEIAPGHTPEEIQEKIEPELKISENLIPMYEGE